MKRIRTKRRLQRPRTSRPKIKPRAGKTVKKKTQRVKKTDPKIRKRVGKTVKKKNQRVKKPHPKIRKRVGKTVKKKTQRFRRSRLRKINPDPLYQSRLVTLLIKRVMRQGKKNFAVRLVYNTLYKLQSIYTRRFSNRNKKPNRKKTHKFFLEKFSAKILECAIRRVVPRMRYVKKKRGRRSYYIPKGIRVTRGISYAIRWLVSTAYCCCLKCTTISSTRAIFRRKLARAIWRTARGRGGALKKKFCMQRFTYR